MAISGGDGSIILTTKVDESGLKKGMQQANKFAQMSTNEQRRMAQSLSKVYRQQGMSQSEAQKKAWHNLKNNTVATKDLAKATEDVAKKTEQATKETKEYGATAKRSGTTAKNTFLAVGKAFLTIGVASASAIVAMTKQAVSAYADYEQLVGGVETLFKGSAQKVIDYANDAFYTAGVSANEYMQQVTSFSASLIKSTAGDTDKAADIANMALIDISDNVNKMGSSMESVTLAYQGFAKQQYMLLDNLKLGYGGTKTEMERLLKDAQALTGVKYDINNLADVYSAIHAIQEELGITGTTAKEAEKTITGSANMMKASWQNVLSAIAGGGDLDRAINNLVYSIQKFFENIVPVVQRSLVGIGRLIERVAPLLVQNVASALIQAIPSLLNAVYQMIIGLAKGIWQGIKALFTGSSGSVTADIKTSVGGIATEAGNASTGMEELGDATEKAGKQAKKSLAAFDELTTLSSDAEKGTAVAPEVSTAGLGGAGGVSSAMSVVPEDNTQISFLDNILDRLKPIQEIFMSGFWKGFQNADFSGIKKSISGIKKSLTGIFTSPEVQNSAQGFVSSVVLAFGQITGSIASIGTTIATNLLGGFNLYLDGNSETIKTRISNIFDASSGIVTSVGNMWETFSDIFSVFADTNGQNLTSNIIGIFSNAFLGILELAVKFGEDFINFLSQPIIDNKDVLKEALDGLLGEFSRITGQIKKLVDELVDGVLNLYDKHISPFIKTLTDVLSDWVDTFVEGYNEHIKPIIDAFADEFENLVGEHLVPMFDVVMKSVGKVIDILNWLWDNILRPIGKWLIKNFLNVFGNVFYQIKDIVFIVIGKISDSIDSIFTIFNGLIDFIAGVFTGDWKRAWEGIKGILKGIVNGFVTMIETGVNLIISAINGIIGGVDNIVGAVGSALGLDWNIPKIPKLNLPRLAQGAVIPPNREFLAVLGDQKRGTNIEAPLDTIKQAVAEVLSQVNVGGSSGRIEVPVIIDGREVARAVREAESNMGSQTVFGGFANVY